MSVRGHTLDPRGTLPLPPRSWFQPLGGRWGWRVLHPNYGM